MVSSPIGGVNRNYGEPEKNGALTVSAVLC